MGVSDRGYHTLWTRKAVKLWVLDTCSLQAQKLRSTTRTLRYNNNDTQFGLIYRQASKTMIVIGYFSIALIVFFVWFTNFWNDTATSKKDLISWIALVIGPLIWPVVLPLSILQLTTKKSVVQAAKSEQS